MVEVTIRIGFEMVKLGATPPNSFRVKNFGSFLLAFCPLKKIVTVSLILAVLGTSLSACSSESSYATLSSIDNAYSESGMVLPIKKTKAFGGIRKLEK